MRVLIVHNRYRLRGGEDQVVENEGALLAQHGHKVCYVYFDNAVLNRRPFWQRLLYTYSNPEAAQRIRAAIVRYQPDILHAHNVFYEATLSGLRVAQQRGIPTLMTLHNYRLACIASSCLRAHQLCTLCVGAHVPWHGIRYRCFQHSRWKSVQLQLITAHHKHSRTFRSLRRLIVLTPFHQSLMQRSLRIPEVRWVVKGHSVPSPPPTNKKRQAFFLYVGRLSHEKGIPLLLSAFEGLSMRVVIIGEGPLADLCTRASSQASITYKGAQPHAVVLDYLQQCQALVYTSIWYETFGLTLIEALACGTPIIAHKTPTTQYVLSQACHLPVSAPYTSAKLRDALRQFQRLSPTAKRTMQIAAKQQYEAHFTQEKNYQSLIQIYQSVLTQRD